MKIRQLAVIVGAALYAVAAWSGEEVQHEMKIELIDIDGHDEIRIELDSDDMDFKLHEMQVGENQSIVDKDGRAILITRGEDGFTFDVDGKTIEMPAFDLHGDHESASVWVSKGDFASNVDVDVRVLHDGMSAVHDFTMADSMEGVMIISEKEIDDATQQLIRIALESAGHEGVHFAGGHGDGPHQIHVIKKVVEVTE